MYVNLLNTHTDYNIKEIKLKKLNGMKLKVFSDNREILIQMYELINLRYPRKDIAIKLNISVEFYDRFKNQQKEFLKYTDVDIV